MKKKIEEMNILRAIACLSVILVHISAIPVTLLEAGSPHLKIFALLNRAFKFTTPTFVFLSGLTLYYSYKDRPFYFREFLKKRLGATLIPYFIWSIIYYGFFVYRNIYAISLRFFVENLLLANTSYHLYFIATILQFYLLFGVFVYFFKRYNPYIILTFLGVINILAIRYVHFQYADRLFISYIFFFGLGCYGAMNMDRIRKKLVEIQYKVGIGYLAISGYYGYQFYQYFILQKPTSVFLVEMTWFVFSIVSIMWFYILAYAMENRIGGQGSKILKGISKSSFYIYLSHPLVLILSEDILTNMGIISITRRFILNLIIVYGTVIPLSIGYTALKDRFNTKKKLGRAKNITLHS